MSQHYITTDKYNVLYGYDEPLDYFFLVIEEHGSDDDHIFSNLDLPDGPCMTIGQIEEKLIEFGIFVPPDLRDNLLEDLISANTRR